MPLYWNIALVSFIFGFALADVQNGIKMVVQNYKEDTNTRLNTQIRKELMASYMYQSYASYFQRADIALHGIHKFFAAAALEEREHAQMLIDYVNTRGGHVAFDDIELNTVCNSVVHWAKNNDTSNPLHDDHFCICAFVSKNPLDASISCTLTSGTTHVDRNNGLIAFQDALVTERYVNSELINLQKAADAVNDAHLTHILEHHFLDEQVQSISQLANYVTRLKSFTKGGGNNYKLGEYIFDTNLNK